MTDIDVYGNIVDADTVEGWVKTTLQAWLPAHLAHQERRRPDVVELLEAIGEEHLPQPKTWPTVSEFDIELHDQLPAVSIVSSGTAGIEHDRRGEVRKTWRMEIAATLAGRNETEARLMASLYLAAVTGALIQGDPTLGGNAENTRYVGPDDLAYGITESGAQRAIYGTAFAVTVRHAIDSRRGPAEPPENPYDPPDAPPSLLEAEIDVTTDPEDMQ